MSLIVASITFDCSDALKVATFWSEALGRSIDRGEPAPSSFFATIGRGDPVNGPTLMFIKVPEPKTVKNRTHLDLVADDRAAEVQRLIALGATHVHDKDEWGLQWTTLADPEGNEFCVAER